MSTSSRARGENKGREYYRARQGYWPAHKPLRETLYRKKRVVIPASPTRAELRALIPAKRRARRLADGKVRRERYAERLRTWPMSFAENTTQKGSR